MQQRRRAARVGRAPHAQRGQPHLRRGRGRPPPYTDGVGWGRAAEAKVHANNTDRERKKDLVPGILGCLN